MKKQPYLPYTDKEKRAWFDNFDTQIASLGASLGLTPAEIAAVHNDRLAVDYMLEILEIFKTEHQERTRYKDLLFEGEIGTSLSGLPGLPSLPAVPAAVPAGVFKRLGKIVQRVKNHPDYNEALGKNLGVIGAERVIDFDNLKVQITLNRTDEDGVVFSFVKGELDGVVVYAGTYAQKIVETTDPAATTEEEPVMIWTEIGRAEKSPFIDTRLNATNKPETRYYRMRYLKKHTPIGKISDTISVVASVYKAGSELAKIVK